MYRLCKIYKLNYKDREQYLFEKMELWDNEDVRKMIISDIGEEYLLSNKDFIKGKVDETVINDILIKIVDLKE